MLCSVSCSSSAHMEDRNVLRRIERERRNQEVQQQETRYDTIAPLFSEPYKINKGDELSTLIQRMLGNFEDGCDVKPMELCSVFPIVHSTQDSRADRSNLQKSTGHTDGSALTGKGLPAFSALLEGSRQKSENWDSGKLPVLSPPAEPLSPLRSSDADDPCPDPHRAEPTQMEVPPQAHTFLLNLHSKLALVNPKKPTAYVRPMDGQDQVTSVSPDIKASPEAYGHLPDHKNAISPLKWPSPSDIGCHEAERVKDILKEMTSWPELLTSICTPSTGEPLTFLVPAEETHVFSTQKAHESSDTVEQNQQGVPSVSSDSDNSSSDTDSEIICQEEQTANVTSLSLHTQAEDSKNWQFGRWLEIDNQQQKPESPCYDIRPDSHDSPARTEAEAQQGCYNNSTHSDTEAGHAQAVVSAPVCESLRVESMLLENNSQNNANTSTHRAKENKKKTERRRVRTESKTRDLSVCTTKHTDRKFNAHTLLVKIELHLLSRIPQEPERAQLCSGVTKKPSPEKNTELKRPAEPNQKSVRKKQKVDKEENRSSSCQNTISQSESTRSSRAMKKSGKQKTVLPPDSQLKKAEAHGKKTCKRHNAPTQPTCPKPRALLQLDRRQLSVEDHMKEAKKLKHKADATLNKMSKALSYLEAALSFVESGLAMEADPQMPKSAYTMFSETLELIRFILKLKNYTDSTAAGHERDFCVLCLRCESLLQMAMFRYRRDSALKYSRTLAEHFKSTSRSASPVNSSVVISQPIQQVAASYVDITALFLNALETWDQAEEMASKGSGLLRELDCVVGPLSLTSSMSSLVQYTRHGLHWIRHNP